MTPLEAILDAFRSERQYQVRRWGCSQPDGTFQEVEHSLAEWLIYMDVWLRRTRHEMAGKSGSAPALEALRKVICLAWAEAVNEKH